jgi:Ca2+/Na+ antiporter
MRRGGRSGIVVIPVGSSLPGYFVGLAAVKSEQHGLTDG